MASLFDPLRISAGAAQAIGTRQAATANNIANALTAGYRRVDVQFESMVTQRLGGGAPNPGAGTRPQPRLEVGPPGPLVPTSYESDIAVSGNGFFVVSDGRETFLTRVGSFHPDAEGRLVNANGFVLLGTTAGTAAPSGGLSGLQPLTVPANIGGEAVVSATVNRAGEVVATLANGRQQVVASVPLARVPAPDALEAVTGTAFRITAASGDATLGGPGTAGLGRVEAGFLEGSNVNLDEEVALGLIPNRITYEANLKSFRTAAAMTRTLLDIKG